MDQRGDGTHNGGNRTQLHSQLISSGDFQPGNHLQGGILAWLEFLVDLGMLDGRFGAGLDMPQHQHVAVNQDNVGNNNIEDNVDNVAVEEVGMEENQDVQEEDPLPGVSRRRPREEDEETEGRSSKRFRWWDEFADSDDDDVDDDSAGDDYVESVDQHVREEDPLPGSSKKRAREDEEEEEEEERRGRKSRRRD